MMQQKPEILERMQKWNLVPELRLPEQQIHPFSQAPQLLQPMATE